MPADVRIVLHLKSLHAMTQNAEMGALLLRKAQAVVARARSTAPVETGNYKKAFSVAFTQTDRRVIRVHNDMPYALAVEYGGSKTTRHRTLGAALDAARGG
jgi:hypothetical protein